MPISVLMFCSQFRPHVGGAERQAEKLSQVLAKKGCSVTILTPLMDAKSKLREDLGGVKIERFPLFDLCRRFKGVRGLGLLNLFLLSRQVRREVGIRIDNYDLLHTHIASPLTSFAMQAGFDHRKPALCKVASSGEKSDLRNTANIGLGGDRIVKKLVSKMPCWVATTSAVEESLIISGVPADRITCIPNGVEIPEYKTELYKGSCIKHFLYLGRISKNCDRDIPTLIRAFDQLAVKHSDVALAIVGGGDLLESTKELAGSTMHGSRIKIPGFQKPEAWLKWADCLVLPSRREGLSNALIEAMSYGLACIANDIPPNREVLDDGKAGILVPIGDVGKLHQKMKLLVTDSKVANHYRQLAMQKVATDYSIDSVAERYIALYTRMLKQR